MTDAARAATCASPADKAGIKPDDVVAAIDDTRVTSASQAARIIRAGKSGDHVTLTLYDIAKGELKPRTVSLTFADEPVPKKKFSVHPQRVLAKEYFYPAFPAANALVQADSSRTDNKARTAKRVGGRAMQWLCAPRVAGGGACARQFPVPCDGG